jgi:hypothetical protein
VSRYVVRPEHRCIHCAKNIVRLQEQEECTELMDVEVIVSTRHIRHGCDELYDIFHRDTPTNDF